MNRNKIYNKYNGQCAYCGNRIEIESFEIDHKEPKRSGGTDEENNLMPTCKTCNHYKRALPLEEYRIEWIGKIHTRIKRIPKNSRNEKGMKRKEYMERILTAYGITEDKPFNGKFYFEIVNNF